MASRLFATLNGAAARHFVTWYGKQVTRHPNYVGPIDWDAVIRTSFGMLMRAQFQESLGMRLILGETHEPELTERIAKRLRPGDTFIDVGANIGYYTLLASQRVGKDGLVFAFEPSPPNLAHLAGNLTLNKCNNVVLYSVALSDTDVVAKLSLPWHINSGVASLGNGPSCHGEACFLPGHTLTATRRLDGLLTPDQLRGRLTVKIDAEGHEPQALRGMENLLAGASDVCVACEVSPASYPVGELCERLASLGFQGEYFSGGRWTRITPQHFPSDMCNAWFWKG
jgi:FkbM family methyltransferase